MHPKNIPILVDVLFRSIELCKPGVKLNKLGSEIGYLLFNAAYICDLIFIFVRYYFSFLLYDQLHSNPIFSVYLLDKKDIPHVENFLVMESVCIIIFIVFYTYIWIYFLLVTSQSSFL